jgi:hypothetical protein
MEGVDISEHANTLLYQEELGKISDLINSFEFVKRQKVSIDVFGD